MSIRIDVSEVYALADDIQRNADEVPAKAELIVAAGGHRTVAVMQTRTPVDTGHLKGSESVDIDGLRFEAGPTAEYGEYVELGTSRMAAEPYAGPAADEVFPTIADALGALGAQILGLA